LFIYTIIRLAMANHTAAPDWSTIPAPQDEGATRHLLGAELPSIPLPATDGRLIDLSKQPGVIVLYAYPRTGVPDVANPDGWDSIPGARGCTPQSCAFRDHFAELKALGVSAVFGLSTQDSAYQREAATRLHLPFPLLSDEQLLLTHAMNLPTFQVGKMTLLKRFTLIVKEGRVQHVFYPVFPPDRNAGDVITWLTTSR
jgi:peroxiredoxin